MNDDIERHWDRDHWDLEPDSVALALEVMAPPSRGKIMREAFYGACRFEDFQRRTRMSPSVLSAQLRDLVAHNLLVKVPYKEAGLRERAEYRLTDKGRDLIPTVISMINWADRWLTGDQRPTVSLQHRNCGAPIQTVFKCANGHDIGAAHDIIASPGPGARPYHREFLS